MSKSFDDVVGCIVFWGLFVCFIFVFVSLCCCYVGVLLIVVVMEEKSEFSMYNVRDCIKLL